MSGFVWRGEAGLDGAGGWGHASGIEDERLALVSTGTHYTIGTLSKTIELS